ncbi:MAG: c-type cytochrome biogenesis protein CcsB [Spirochaetales bacterium]|jgi:cytochrome c-type biogenesis protein CcsB|nr:c-type cytochrome biogenesis protein CcsB [Spirochaetales bacterium]
MIPTIAFFILAAVAVVQVLLLILKKTEKDVFSHYGLLAAALLLLGTMVERSVRINFAAITNTYESLIFFAGIIALLLFIYRFQKRLTFMPWIMFGGTFAALAFLAISSSPITSSELTPPIPALQSYWLVLHVIFAFIGEAFFTVAFVASIYYLITKDEDKKKNLDRVAYTTIGIGYPIFTAGALIFGAIWAKYAWGSYWSWDPKETWALITFLAYTVYLHLRLIRKMRGKITSIVAIVGYLLALFTFFGVNYLLSGLHSYG